MSSAERASVDTRAVLELAGSRPPGLRRTRLVCVDGPAGSGKTTFATALVDAARDLRWSVALVHMDDVFEGWDGLADAGRRVRTSIVEPLVQGETGGYLRYDWERRAFAEEVPVPGVDLLVIEGVGSADSSYQQHIGVLVWVWAPARVRLQRGLQRDGEEMEPRWRQWMLDERELHRSHRTRERADLVLDGQSGPATVGAPRTAG